MRRNEGRKGGSKNAGDTEGSSCGGENYDAEINKLE